MPRRQRSIRCLGVRQRWAAAIGVGAALTYFTAGNLRLPVKRSDARAALASADLGVISNASRPDSSNEVSDDEEEFSTSNSLQNARDLSVAQASPVHYRLHGGAGSEKTGELHWRGAGKLWSGGTSVLDSWLLEYHKRFPSLHARLHGWQPEARLSAQHGGVAGSVRWSKPLLGGEPDGSGLDVHLDTQVEVARTGGPLALQQRAEVVFGPQAQAKYANFSLPVGLLVGAAFAPGAEGQAEGETEGTYLGPFRLYTQINVPGFRELRGWLLEADVEERRLGGFSGMVHRAWSGLGGEKTKANWFLQHQRTHGSVWLPKFIADGLGAASSLVAGHLQGSSGPELARQLAPRPAVVPATRLRVGSEGPGAALALESSQAGLGGSGWNGVMEVGRLGWGARLSMAMGIAEEGVGQPRYAVTAHGPWRGRVSLSHDLKWVFADGQWAGVTVQDGGPGKPPRVNLGVELR